MSAKKAALERLRRTAAEARADTTEMLAGAATSYALGSLEASGRLAQVPQIMGLPRTVTVAAAALLAKWNTSGKTRSVAAGVAGAAQSIAIYQFSKGATVMGEGILSGAIDRPRDGRRVLADDAAELRAQADALLSGGSSVDAELADLERRRAG